VHRVRVLAYPDGPLPQHRSSLGAAIGGIMRLFDPDTVITFGTDGGYGYPDHIAISRRARTPRPPWPAAGPSPASRRHS
jgi:LmbE family N-acetylglucosaminyl deacetylase